MVDRGDMYPSQKSFALTTVVVEKDIGAVYRLLASVGSFPSVVYRITVPSGEPSGSEISNVRGLVFSAYTMPGMLNTGLPNILL